MKILWSILVGLMPVFFIACLFGCGISVAMWATGSKLQWWNYISFAGTAVAILLLAGVIGWTILGYDYEDDDEV